MITRKMVTRRDAHVDNTPTRARSSGSHSSRGVHADRLEARHCLREFDRERNRNAPFRARGELTTEEGHKLRLALRLAGVTQARAARVLDARQTQLSAWMALGKGPNDVLQRLETAFGFRTDSLVDICMGRDANVLCHRFKARGSETCAACAMQASNVVVMNGNGTGEERIPSCVSCGKSEEDQVRLRPARML